MRVRRPTTVAWVEDGGTWYVSHLLDGGIAVLEGSAALIWREAIAGEADVDEIATRVAGAIGAETEDIADDVRGLVAELVALGLLSELPVQDPGSPA